MKKIKTLSSKKLSDYIFFAVLVTIPIIQVLIFYFGVNINSILMAFKEYNFETGETTINVFGNFKRFFRELTNEDVFKICLTNSFRASLWTVLFHAVFALLFSLYIYKNCLFSTFFKIILFLPSIISSIVMSTMYQQFVDSAIPDILVKVFDVQIQPLLTTPKTTWATTIFFNLWGSFGAGVLIYVSGMNSISVSISEAAQLDGAGFFKESWYITLPLIYPNIVTFITVGIAGILTNHLALYNFWDFNAPNESKTMGYWLFAETKRYEGSPDMYYQYLAAIGILLSIVEIPFTLIARKLMVKFGPSVE